MNKMSISQLCAYNIKDSVKNRVCARTESISYRGSNSMMASCLDYKISDIIHYNKNPLLFLKEGNINHRSCHMIRTHYYGCDFESRDIVNDTKLSFSRRFNTMNPISSL